MEEDELKKYKNVVIDKGGNSGLNGLFASIFLPRGYPESVSKDYMQYQVETRIRLIKNILLK